MKKISVIVPVYNVEKYLKRCLDSLVNQTLKNIEIIVINDGSTDNSLNIIREYKDIKLINQKNSGIGSARNLGIENANGEYIAFIDSDDYVDINMFEECYEHASKNRLDILVLNYYKVFENTNEVKEFFIDSFDITSLKDNKELLFKINSSPWNKLYKKSLFDDKNMRFPERTKYEDLGLINILLEKANRIGYLNKSYNYYLIRTKSETNTIDEKVYDIFKILDIINKHYKKIGIYNSELEYLNMEKILTYTISERDQKNKEFRNKFIDDAFKYLDDNFNNWRNNKYYKRRNKLKALIEKNKWVTKLYCNIYNKIKR